MNEFHQLKLSNKGRNKYSKIIIFIHFHFIIFSASKWAVSHQSNCRLRTTSIIVWQSCVNWHLFLDSYCVTTKLSPINWIIKLFKSHILLKKIISVCFLLLLSVKEEAGALNYGAHPHTHSVSLLGGFPL